MTLFKLTTEQQHVKYVVAVDIETALKYGSGFPGAVPVTSITQLPGEVQVLIDSVDLEVYLYRELDRELKEKSV